MINKDQTLEEQREELKERWSVLKVEINNVGYNEKDAAGAELAMWAVAKSIQFGVIFEQEITKETNKRLDGLLTEAHGIMFFDAIALGKKS